MNGAKDPFPRPISIAPRVSRMGVDETIAFMETQAREAGPNEQQYG